MTGATQPIGTLFESVNYYSDEDLIKFIDTIKEPQAFYIINQALNMAFRRGLFTMQETEILSKSLRILNK